VNRPPICVIAYRTDERPDDAVAAAVAALLARGFKVRGLLQEGSEGGPSCCATLFLEDIGSGRRVEIFQNRGREARGCRLDASGLAEAAAWVREAVESRPDVLVLNRFGRQESEGRGLLDEIGAAVLAGIPVVIPVNDVLMQDWDAFAGDVYDRIPAAAGRIEEWCRRKVTTPA
jgi:hypothetical protein